MSESQVGILLVNLGSPDSPKTAAVRRYLREFLMDGRVIDIPALARWLLVHGIILPLRPRRSAEAYKKIWTSEGSPLIVESKRLLTGVRGHLGEDYHVELAMRYGNPSIASGLNRLLERSCRKIIVFPLYPQYASATTGSIYQECMRVLQDRWSLPEISFVGDFFDQPDFIEAFATVARPQLQAFKQDFVLFSYHGLPEKHLQRADLSQRHCLQSKDCCASVSSINRFCYRAQCVATTKALATALQLKADSYSVSFQSRLGKAQWIQPYTDQVLPELRQKGVKRLAIMCPAFVADCLETLEEIGMQAKQQWQELGGDEFHMVTSLNAEAAWVDAVCRILHGHSTHKALNTASD